MGKRNKLTDRQIKKIISDYAMNNNKCATARINNVTETTVRTILKKYNNEATIKIEQKTKENTQDILKYIDESFEKQKKVIDLSLNALISKLEKPDMFTNVKDIATVYGIISDKAVKNKELDIRTEELKLKQKDTESDVLDKLDKLLEAQNNA